MILFNLRRGLLHNSLFKDEIIPAKRPLKCDSNHSVKPSHQSVVFWIATWLFIIGFVTARFKRSLFQLQASSKFRF